MTSTPDTVAVPREPTLTEADLRYWKKIAESYRNLGSSPLEYVSVEAGIMIQRLIPYAEELLKIAEQVGEEKDPFAAWEKIAASPTLSASEPVASPKALKLAERIHNHDILFLNTGGCLLQKADKDLIEAALRTHPALSVSPSVESKCDIADALERTTKAMAQECKVGMGLWNGHSNACLNAVHALRHPVSVTRSVEEIAETVHKARWPKDRQLAITPFADEDSIGREYCFRIAQSIASLFAEVK